MAILSGCGSKHLNPKYTLSPETSTRTSVRYGLLWPGQGDCSVKVMIGACSHAGSSRWPSNLIAVVVRIAVIEFEADCANAQPVIVPSITTHPEKLNARWVA